MDKFRDKQRCKFSKVIQRPYISNMSKEPSKQATIIFCLPSRSIKIISKFCVLLSQNFHFKSYTISHSLKEGQ